MSALGHPGYPVILEVTDDGGRLNSIAREISILLGPDDADGKPAISLLDVHLCPQTASGVMFGITAQRASSNVDGDGNVDMPDVGLLAKYPVGMQDHVIHIGMKAGARGV